MRKLCSITFAALVGLAVPGVAPGADAPAAPVTKTPADLKWVPNPDAPGVSTAVASGDPATGPHSAFHKFVAGFSAPLHTHTANTKIVVLAGTMTLTGKDGKQMKFPAGSFYTQPSTYEHVTTCEAGAECVVYLEADAKWDLKPSAAKKN